MTRVIVLVACLLLPARAIASLGSVLYAGPPAVTPGFFGAYVGQLADWPPTVPFGALGKGNCVQWSDIEPSRGTFNWSLLDQYAADAQAKEVDFFYSPGTWAFTPWATDNAASCEANPCGGVQKCSGPAANEQDWKDWAAALAGRYCGTIKYWELFNEPYQSGGYMTAAQLAVVARDEESAIRAACPQALFGTPSMGASSSTMVQYANDYFSAGGPTDMTFASVHIYTDGADPVDLPESIDPATGHVAYFGLIQPTIAANLPGVPIWMTEGSWGSATQSQGFTTAAEQAAFVARYYLIEWALGFQRVYWYAWDNAAYGTLRPSSRGDGSSLPETAYDQVFNWMTGRQMNQPCAWAADHITWTCGFLGGGGYHALAAWDTAGSESFTPPNPSTYTQYRNLAGGITAYPGSGAVTIGISPILFEN